MSNPVSAISGGASVIGGISSSKSSKSAAKAQQAASDASVAEQRRQYDTAREDTAPYRDSGVAANRLLDEYLGIGAGFGGVGATEGFKPLSYEDWAKTQTSASRNLPGNPYGRSGGIYDAFLANQYDNPPQPSQAAYQDYLSKNPARAAFAGVGATHDPNIYGSLLKPFSWADLNKDVVYNNGLQFGLDEGKKAIDRLASSRGGMESGATLKALSRYANDYATTKTEGAYSRFQNNKDSIYNMLGGQANRGLNAVGVVTGAGQNSANNVSSALEGAGNAKAAGIIGSANAWSGALGGLANQFPSNGSIFNPSNNGRIDNFQSTNFWRGS